MDLACQTDLDKKRKSKYVVTGLPSSSLHKIYIVNVLRHTLFEVSHYQKTQLTLFITENLLN